MSCGKFRYKNLELTLRGDLSGLDIIIRDPYDETTALSGISLPASELNNMLSHFKPILIPTADQFNPQPQSGTTLKPSLTPKKKEKSVDDNPKG